MSESVQQYYSFNRSSVVILLLVMTVAPGYIWSQSIGDLSVYIDYETPPGQVCYILSKLAGMYAIFLLWLQVVLAFLSKTPAGEKLLFRGLKFHRKLGFLAAGFLLLHVVLFVTAASLRTGHFAYKLLLPDFSDGFYAFAVTLGVLALYGAVIAIIAGYARAKGIHKAKWLHRVSVPVLILALAHCLLIGSETRFAVMMVVYVLMVSILIAAFYYSYHISSRRSYRLSLGREDL